MYGDFLVSNSVYVRLGGLMSGSDTNSQALTDILLGLLPRYRL